MDKFTVKLLTAAKRDLHEAKAFIQKDNPITARRVMERIIQELSTLEVSPEAGPKIHDTRLHAMGYRYWLVLDGKYIAFYVVFKNARLVQIRRIISTRQDYLRILYNDHPKGSRLLLSDSFMF